MAQKGTNAAVVGGNNDEIIALDGNDNIKDRRYEDHPQYHPLVAALSSKKHASLTAKKEILKMFLPQNLDIEKYWRDPDLYKLFRLLLDDIRRNGCNESQIKRNFTMAFASLMITNLYILDQWNKELPDDRRLSRNDPSAMVKKAFASLVKFVGPILEAYDIDQKKNQQKKNRSKANDQVSGTRVQDTLPFDIQMIDADSCPKCDHLFCMPILTVEEVKAKQKDLDDKFDRKMVEWSSKPATSRGGKPRRQKSVAMELACYCCRNHCNLRPDGGNCIACRDVQGGMLVYRDDGRVLKCTCDICNCKCQVKFLANDRRNIQLETEQKKRATEGSSATPTDTPSFFNSVIKESLQQAAIDAAQEPVQDPTMVHQNALSLAAGSIFTNPSLQSVPLRNNMQKAVPCTTMTSTGLDIDQLRRRHRLGLPISRHRLGLPIPVNPKPAAIITPSSSPIASTGAGRDKRFYRNGLSVEQLVPPSVAAAAAATNQSSISTLDDDSDDIEIIEPKKEDDRKPKAVESSSPQVVKRGRKRLNKMLHSELKKKGEGKDKEKIQKIKKAKEGLSSEKRTKDTTEYFEDNEPEYKDSQEIAEDAIGYFDL